MNKTISIISFSPINRDGRVLRQIDYLQPFYSLDVIGYGVRPASLSPSNQWFPVNENKLASKNSARINYLRDVSSLFALNFPASIQPEYYEKWYWAKPVHKQALDYAIQNKADAYYANDLEALPVAAKAAEYHHARLVFDAHEYAPLEWEDNFLWRITHPPMIRFFLRKYAKLIDGFITVTPEIGKRYLKEFELKPIIILNAPKLSQIPDFKPVKDKITLIHHGGAMKQRRLEQMIEVLEHCDNRFTLTFMLVGNQSYVSHLKSFSQRLAPGRVNFTEPVPPGQIVAEISKFDMGIFVLKPSNYNYLMTLPNKLFDFIAAGLAVCIGPSPEMTKIIKGYEIGCVSQTFRPRDVASTLNALTTNEINRMKQSSIKAANELNSDVEMKKLLDLFEQLIG